MKDCFVLYYNLDSISVNEVYDIFKRLENCIEGKTLFVLPDAVCLKDYSKEELVQLLKIYSNYTEELLNE